MSLPSCYIDGLHYFDYFHGKKLTNTESYGRSKNEGLKSTSAIRTKSLSQATHYLNSDSK